MKKFTAMHKKYDTITAIPKREYEGYIWGSDAKKPKVYCGNEKIGISENEGYIIEALLYCKKDNASLHIRHSGEYHIHEYNLDKLPEGAELKEIGYLSHSLNGVEKVCFKQLWLPKKDPNCENMEVLKMKALVFTGFNNCKNPKS